MLTYQQSKDFYKKVKNTADIKALALGDLFFLLVHVLNRPDIDQPWLYDRCREVQANPDGHLDLWAREHGKSSIITFGLSIQNILNDPNITIGIFSHSRGISKGFLKQIKREFEANKLLQQLFPHICRPTKHGERTWSDEAIIVERFENPKEATVEAWGLVDGQPTGRHFKVLVYDDVVTLESVSTPEQIKKTTEAWRMSLNLGARGGVIRMIGTRYHLYDTYQTVMEQNSAIPRVYPATDDGTRTGKPVFLTKELLEKKYRDFGIYVYNSQMLQNPTADNAQGFNLNWFCSVKGDLNGHGMNKYIIVDPAGEKKKNSDYSSFWVIGLNHDNKYYVLDGIRDRLNLTERTETLFRLHRKHKPIGVGYEKYGMQSDIEHIKYIMNQENYRFDIKELGGQMPKADRIKRLVPIFEQGRIYFPDQIMKRTTDNTLINLTDIFFREEFISFPVSKHDDMLDCMARILDPDLRAIFPEYIEKKYINNKAKIQEDLWGEY